MPISQLRNSGRGIGWNQRLIDVHELYENRIMRQIAFELRGRSGDYLTKKSLL
ncbi:hypothetical protein KIN20_023411 [Parelaphostrongylus tenuis]|uniref:Uncharacterized protein n=1 Tax=Parelaphostrongylus tenuis TaxID=148309 RepID=A0AAD5N913_PARTN|nr:hypothetical protein KIN20_023411 [Parelaphostrongylus tenuis]